LFTRLLFLVWSFFFNFTFLEKFGINNIRGL
jgi:hypothetical protein